MSRQNADLCVGGPSRKGKSGLVRKWRREFAGVLAALYALFLLIPPAAVAAIPGHGAAHCLSEVLQPALGAHDHYHVGQATDHEHAGPVGGPAHDHSTNEECCGLFGLSMLLPPIADAGPFEHQSSAPLLPGAVFVLSGRSPPPVDRPPRHLLHV